MIIPTAIALASIATRLSTTPATRHFVVRIESHEVGCEVLVNDIPVESDDYPGIVTLPINPFLIEGQNTVTIRSRPVPAATKKHPQWDKDAARSCEATVSALVEGKGPGPSIARVEVKPSESAPVLSKQATFAIALGYPTPAWTNSAKIGQDAATKKLILDKYREFHRLLASKDLQGLMTFSAAKAREYAKAMNEPEFESSMKNSYKESVTSAGELIGIDVQKKNGLRYEYSYGGRLVSVMNDEHRSIIQYYDSDEGVTTQYKLYFYFDGKDFVLIL